jgi:hypothetical protein
MILLVFTRFFLFDVLGFADCFPIIAWLQDGSFNTNSGARTSDHENQANNLMPYPGSTLKGMEECVLFAQLPRPMPDACGFPVLSSSKNAVHVDTVKKRLAVYIRCFESQ